MSTTSAASALPDVARALFAERAEAERTQREAQERREDELAEHDGAMTYHRIKDESRRPSHSRAPARRCRCRHHRRPYS
jgi:hypothetical protein